MRKSIVHFSVSYEDMKSVSGIFSKPNQAMRMVEFHKSILNMLSIKSCNIFTLSIDDKKVLTCILKQDNTQYFPNGMSIKRGYEGLVDTLKYVSKSDGSIEDQLNFTRCVCAALQDLNEHSVTSDFDSDVDSYDSDDSDSDDIIENFNLRIQNNVVNVVHVLFKGELFFRFERSAYGQ